jgi:hypothetical protein
VGRDPHDEVQVAVARPAAAAAACPASRIRCPSVTPAGIVTSKERRVPSLDSVTDLRPPR